MCELCRRIIMAGHTATASGDAPPVFAGIDLSISAEDREKMPKIRAHGRTDPSSAAATEGPDTAASVRVLPGRDAEGGEQ